MYAQSGHFFPSPRDQHTKQKKKCCMLKTQLAAVYDCKTSRIIVIFLCMRLQYRRSLAYRADQSTRYGKDRLYYRRVICVHRIYTWLLR